MSLEKETEQSRSEVESDDLATEITLLWGESEVLHVAHLSSPRSFHIGEHGSDYLIGSEVLGALRIPIVVPAKDGMAIVIPEGADGVVCVSDRTKSLHELAAEGRLEPCADLPCARCYVLPRQAVASVSYRGLTWTVKSTYAGKKIGVGELPPMRLGRHSWTLLSLSVHAIILATFYLMPPSTSALSLDLLDTQSRLVQVMLRAEEVREIEPPLDGATPGEESAAGERAAGDEGATGDETSAPTRQRFGVRGPRDNPDPQLPRERAMEQAAVAGAIGVLHAMLGSVDAPTSVFGVDDAIGADPMSALGALTGDQLGRNFGFGGLGPQGTGRGAGGNGEGTVGLGGLGTIGGVPGGGTGGRYGVGVGGLGHRGSRVPRPRLGSEVEIRGSLSREIIRRTIQRHINEVRYCYEQELTQRPDLRGRVTVSFIIGATGAVSTATTMNTTLHNARVEGCLVQAVRRWTFPEPDGGGVVGVNYPFVFDSSGS